ncbi:MAG: hypothetical protein Q4F23_02250 [Coriobacteriia bacterium]|nr:hypothetical protein [Coriobacteriia bacterium]
MTKPFNEEPVEVSALSVAEDLVPKADLPVADDVNDETSPCATDVIMPKTSLSAPDDEQLEDLDGDAEDDSEIPEPDDPYWDDLLHYDADELEPDQLDYLEALAARIAGETQETEAEPLYREDIEFVQALCTRATGAPCDRCVRVCPQAAISFDDSGLPRIKDELCTNCGLCAGICDGFSSTRITLEDLSERALSVIQDGMAVTFACNDMIPTGIDVAENVIVVPCLGYLPPEFLTKLFAHGALVNVCCDFDLCASCQVAGPTASQLFEHAFTTAEAQTGAQIGFVNQVPTQQSLLESLAEGARDESDRRNMLSGLTSTMTDVATGQRRSRTSSSVLEFQEKMERMRAAGHIKQHEGMTLEEVVSDHRIPKYWPRRHLLMQAIEEKPELGNRISLWTATTASDACQQSHECVEACPTGARQVDEQGLLVIDARYCIACGSCIAACPHAACDFVETSAHDLFGEA